MACIRLGLFAGSLVFGAASAASDHNSPDSQTCLSHGTCGAEPESGDAAGLMQVRKAAAKSDSYEIILKAPPTGGLTPVQTISSSCAEGFNAAYEKCLGGKNSWLMHIYIDASGKAYCGYQGGEWTATTDNYPDHSACFASPGFSEALFYDDTTKVLMTWGKEVKVSNVATSYDPSLSCEGTGGTPCSTSVVPKDRRTYTISQQSHEIPSGQDYSFTWSPSVGYVGITTITGGTSQVSMYIKNLNSGAGLSTDVPCGQTGSVQDQASTFPVKGLSSQCGSEGDDYYMLFAEGSIMVCFPGSAC